MGTIYYIQAGKKGPIKIGFTKKLLEDRLKALQTGNHKKLHVLGSETGTKALEKERHGQFAFLKKRGEWFAPDSILIVHIEKLKD